MKQTYLLDGKNKDNYHFELKSKFFKEIFLPFLKKQEDINKVITNVINDAELLEIIEQYFDHSHTITKEKYEMQKKEKATKLKEIGTKIVKVLDRYFIKDHALIVEKNNDLVYFDNLHDDIRKKLENNKEENKKFLKKRLFFEKILLSFLKEQQDISKFITDDIKNEELLKIIDQYFANGHTISKEQYDQKKFEVIKKQIKEVLDRYFVKDHALIVEKNNYLVYFDNLHDDIRKKLENPNEKSMPKTQFFEKILLLFLKEQQDISKFITDDIKNEELLKIIDQYFANGHTISKEEYEKQKEEEKNKNNIIDYIHKKINKIFGENKLKIFKKKFGMQKFYTEIVLFDDLPEEILDKIDGIDIENTEYFEKKKVFAAISSYVMDDPIVKNSTDNDQVSKIIENYFNHENIETYKQPKNKKQNSDKIIYRFVRVVLNNVFHLKPLYIIKKKNDDLVYVNELPTKLLDIIRGNDEQNKGITIKKTDLFEIIKLKILKNNELVSSFKNKSFVLNNIDDVALIKAIENYFNSKNHIVEDSIVIINKYVCSELNKIFDNKPLHIVKKKNDDLDGDLVRIPKLPQILLDIVGEKDGQNGEETIKKIDLFKIIISNFLRKENEIFSNININDDELIKIIEKYFNENDKTAIYYEQHNKHRSEKKSIIRLKRLQNVIREQNIENLVNEKEKEKIDEKMKHIIDIITKITENKKLVITNTEEMTGTYSNGVDGYRCDVKFLPKEYIKKMGIDEDHPNYECGYFYWGVARIIYNEQKKQERAFEKLFVEEKELSQKD